MNIKIINAFDDSFLIMDEKQNCVGKIIINPLIDSNMKKETREAIEQLFKGEK